MKVDAAAGVESPEALRAEIGRLAGTLLAARPDTPWRALADGGLLALAVPAACGGEGLGVAETAVVLTALGHRALDTPALATALGVLALARWGSAQQQDTALRPVATDAAGLTAVLNVGRRPDPQRPAVTAHRTGEGLELDGAAVGVPYADTAHRMLVPVLLEREPALVLLDPQTPGVRRLPAPTSSGSPVSSVRFEAVPVPAAAVVPGGPAPVADLYRLAGAGAAAVADGLVAGALELTAGHVATRRQFGRPLVTLQAVALQLADVAIVSRTLHLAAVAAAEALDAVNPDPDAWADAEVAALLAVEDARCAIATTHHLHGGTGVDLSYPLPAYSAAATDLAHLLGGPGRGLAALASRLADPDRDEDRDEDPDQGPGDRS